MSREQLLREAERISAQEHQRLAQEKKAEHKRKAQERIESMLSHSGIPSRYFEWNFENSDHSTHPEAWDVAENFAMNFDTIVGGMIIHGDVGTGKGHLASVIGNYLLMNHYSVAYITALEFVIRYRAAQNQSDFLDKMSGVDLLILDEIGVQSRSDFEANMIGLLVDMRSREKRKTIAISNLPPSEIAEIVGRRTMERLLDGAIIVKMSGKSRRDFRR